MEMFYDRITQSRTDSIENSGSVLGQWLLVPESSTENFLNSVPLSAGDFLVPVETGTWSLLCSNGLRYEGAVVRSQILNELESESIRNISRRLTKLITDNAGWLEWSDVIPLVPGMSKTIEATSLEKLIKKNIGFLKAVCVKPRAHLHVEVERVAVSRARRVPTKASEYLAAHTEDWDRPIVNGVMPKRILAEVSDDQIDIYENRVAARLIDNLSLRLSVRIQEIRKVIKLLKDKENYSGKAGGTYLRRNRITTLWGDSLDANEGLKTAKTSLRELEDLKIKLMGLMDTELYREVPRRAFVATTLRQTNILSNDKNYKHVADLWQEWSKTGHSNIKWPKDIYLAAQELCKGLDRFLFLLAVRALSQLGYEPSNDCIDIPIKPGCHISLVGHGTFFELTWNEDGSIQVQLSNSCLRLITLASDLSAGSSDKYSLAIIERILSSISPSNETTVVLYAASDAEEGPVSSTLLDKLHSVGNDPRNGLPKHLGFMPISPWEIGSVERVARILRWAIDNERYLDYPIEISVQPAADADFQKGLRDKWLEMGNGILRLIRPPQDYEWRQFGIEDQLTDARKQFEVVKMNHDRISESLREAVRDGRTGTLNQQKKTNHHLRVQYEKKVDELERLTREFIIGRDKLMMLLECPACRTSVDPLYGFESRGGGSFDCHCPDCKALWGTRLCLNGHKFSVMLPSEWGDEENLLPGWEDNIYGSDLLAVPARTGNGEWGFVCPQCGTITT